MEKAEHISSIIRVLNIVFMSQKGGNNENFARDIDMTRACLFLFVGGVQRWVVAETGNFITFLFNTSQII
ncbi:hypothetical protein WH297_18250 [Ochrobactrum vermis]|uniref:Uncharacterized protein n=1 Tax=Ochrobactrum vermis TaxID=1827297 RepID=A0ABU8PJB3_9HYPH|nr:hypothetical protein [Ochrobactrum vermis]